VAEDEFAPRLSDKTGPLGTAFSRPPVPMSYWWPQLIRTSVLITAFATNSRKILLLVIPENLALHREWHLADFIQEQRATIALLKPSNPHRCGAGERSLLVAKQFAFKQVLWDCGAVDRNKRLRAPIAVVMNRTGHQFFP